MVGCILGCALVGTAEGGAGVLPDGGEGYARDGLALLLVGAEAEPDSPNAPPRRSIAEGLDAAGDLIFGEVADAVEGLVTCAGVAADGAPSVSGSGIGPSMAHRLLSYFERMNCSILLSIDKLLS